MKRSIFTFAILAILGTGPLARAATFQVTPSGGIDCNTGICDLQSALDAAAINGEDNILNLAPGDYNAGLGTFTYAPVIEAGSLTLTGDAGGGTIINGGGNQSMSIDTMGAGADSLSDISIRNITFQGGVGTDLAGGLAILTQDASAALDHCKFLQNKNINTPNLTHPNFAGGGLSIYAAQFGSVSVTNSEFRKNAVSSDGGGAFLFSLFGDILVQGNTFVGNTAGPSLIGGSGVAASGFSGAGGAFALSVAGSLTVDRNYFFENASDTAAGGFMGLALEGSGIFTNNIIGQNVVLSLLTPSATVGGGGALLITSTGALIAANNTLFGNKVSSGDGGGLYIYVGGLSNAAVSVDIYNNIIFGNTAIGGPLCVLSCNDIFVLDTSDPSDPSAVGASVNVFNNDYADIFFRCDPNQGCVPHQNVDLVTNIHADPLFAGTGVGDFHLLPGSPAIDTGTALGPVIPIVDFDGNPRNQGKSIDMGALEFASSPPVENCANNVDDDGDLKVDCLDPDCTGSDACQGTTPPGSENCANNLDDDGDGLTDCGDPNCKGAIACLDTNPPPSDGSENCSNNVDDDGDGQIDCNDSDCAAACGGDNNPSPPPNISVNGGCAMTPSPHFSFPFVLLGVPLIWALRRRRVKT